MFANCTNLKKAANIYLEIINTNSCAEMYFRCTALVKPPKVYTIDTQGGSQFQGFLSRCFSLKYGVDFSKIATLGDSSFANCYYSDYNLETPGKIGTKSLRSQGSTFSQMYYNCSKLKYGPELSGVTSQVISTFSGSTFNRMFQSCTNMVSGPTKLNIKMIAADSCSNMFNSCHSLINFMDISSIEALSGSGNQFNSMYTNCYALKEVTTEKFLTKVNIWPEGLFRYAFQNCFNLTTSPEITATNIGNYACQSMFNGCYNLNKITKKIPAITLGAYACNGMFSGCSKIIDAPIISATAFTEAGVMKEMFLNCTKLSGIHQNNLLATNLTNNCYQGMFNGCKSLSSIPEHFLPATNLTNYCYEQMFRGCTNLVEAPELPATILAPYCYQNMFYGDTKLNKIKVHFSDWTNNSAAINATYQWMYNVQTTSGDFICPHELTDERGINRIPNNWSKVDI